jgi:hypothetical protein
MKKRSAETDKSKVGPLKPKEIKNKSEVVQQMLWGIALNGRTRITRDSFDPHPLFNCLNKE